MNWVGTKNSCRHASGHFEHLRAVLCKITKKIVSGGRNLFFKNCTDSFNFIPFTLLVQLSFLSRVSHSSFASTRIYNRKIKGSSPSLDHLHCLQVPRVVGWDRSILFRVPSSPKLFSSFGSLGIFPNFLESTVDWLIPSLYEIGCSLLSRI